MRLIALFFVIACNGPESGVSKCGTLFEDADGDGYGSASSESSSACTDDPAWFSADDLIDVSGDCDDADVAVHPDAEEACDGLDNDCDGEIDEGDQVLFADRDGDGYGDAAATLVTVCAASDGYVGNPDDCDDTRSESSPLADEACNGIDDDCDGTVDDPPAVDQSTWYLDLDRDGFGDPATAVSGCDQPAGYILDGTDCDDASVVIAPSADERCDGVDNDCDGETDEDDAVGAPEWYADADGDGYGDNDDSRAACDAPEGYVRPDGDCDDGRAETHPAASEYCNGYDDDCDRFTDEGDAVDAETWYEDTDGDGYGDPATETIDCDPPSADSIDEAGDCDDGDDHVYPAAAERCNGLDDDCDGAVPADEVDADGDGLRVCDGDTDDAGVAATYTVGGTTSSWTETEYFRANLYSPYASGILESFEVYLGLSGSCDVDFYVHTSSSSSGPWTAVWSDTVSASAGTRFIASGDIDLAFAPGTYYGLGVGWNCAATYYAMADSGADGGLGIFTSNYYSNSYPGYSSTYAPTSSGGTSTCYNQNIYVSF